MRQKNGLVCFNALFTISDILIRPLDKEKANYYKDNPEAHAKSSGARIKAEIDRLTAEEISASERLGWKPFTQPVLPHTILPCPSLMPSSASGHANTG